ncbi:TPA: phage integrase SAM-like domain-containing protein, partial [Clostridioides difficile]|nr:phage integrase SAM-like domain-containing protein [Clostridioides difficile]
MTKEGMRRSIDGFIIKEREAEKSKNTVRHYAHVLDLLYDFLPEGELNKTGIIEFKEHLLESGFEPSTVQNYITIVNKWLKYA